MDEFMVRDPRDCADQEAYHVDQEMGYTVNFGNRISWVQLGVVMAAVSGMVFLLPRSRLKRLTEIAKQTLPEKRTNIYFWQAQPINATSQERRRKARINNWFPLQKGARQI